MKHSTHSRLILVAGLLAAVGIVPAYAADISFGSQDDDPIADPTAGGSTQQNWNPTVTCEIKNEEDDIWDLLECMLDRIANRGRPCPVVLETPTYPDGGNMNLEENNEPPECNHPTAREDFDVYHLPYPDLGIRIRRHDNGAEIERITVYEMDPGLPSVELRLDKPDRVAYIRKIGREPKGDGQLFVTVNNHKIRADTREYATSVELTAKVVNDLRKAGFDILYKDPFILVRSDNRDKNGPVSITQVAFHSTDSNVIGAELRLVPLPEMVEFVFERP